MAGGPAPRCLPTRRGHQPALRPRRRRRVAVLGEVLSLAKSRVRPVVETAVTRVWRRLAAPTSPRTNVWTRRLHTVEGLPATYHIRRRCLRNQWITPQELSCA